MNATMDPPEPQCKLNSVQNKSNVPVSKLCQYCHCIEKVGKKKNMYLHKLHACYPYECVVLF